MSRNNVVIGICKLVFVTLIGTLGAVLIAGDAQARMYQWRTAATNAAQLSGTPPAWYRSEYGGPRVRVFDSGNLVDDTAIELPSDQRKELRDEAFRESEQRQRAAALKRLERLASQQRRRREAQERAEKEKIESKQQLAQRSRDAQPGSAAQAPVSSISPNEPLDDATVARLKALIGAFDRSGGSSQ